MKKSLILPAILLSSIIAAPALIFHFDLSPPGTDAAVGLSPLNEVPAVTSAGSGGTIGAGISFDTDTGILTLNVGYGSAFGFGNLSGPATAMHIHGAATAGANADVIFDLAANHAPAADPAQGGFIGGTVVYTPERAVELLAGLHYINVHTALNPPGEIRGQLIAITVAPSVTCPPPADFECDSPDGRSVTLNVSVADEDGDALEVVWSVNGVAVQTNAVAAGGPPTSANVSLTRQFALGTHAVQVSVSDGIAPAQTCSTTVRVVDTQPPVIHSLTASPNVLWPPNHKMVPVSIAVVASDECGPVTSRIISIRSNEAEDAKGSGNTAPDFLITGDLSCELRAERSGKGKGRIYTVTVEVADLSDNRATGEVLVVVPHSRGKKMVAPNVGHTFVPPGRANTPRAMPTLPPTAKAKGKKNPPGLVPSKSSPGRQK